MSKYRPFWAVSLSIPIIGTITWLAIFEHSYHRGRTTGFIEEHWGEGHWEAQQEHDYLLTGENPGGSKFKRAQDLVIPMIDEEELMRMVEEASG